MVVKRSVDPERVFSRRVGGVEQGRRELHVTQVPLGVVDVAAILGHERHRCELECDSHSKGFSFPTVEAFDEVQCEVWRRAIAPNLGGKRETNVQVMSGEH